MSVQPAALDDPRTLNAEGVAALTANDTARAAGLFARAAAADPEASALWMNLAKARRLLGDGEGERASLTRALEIDQRDFMALVRMAELHERLGEDADAALRWSNVLALAPGLDSGNADFAHLVTHAGDFVARTNADRAAVVDGALAEPRARADPSMLRRFDACVDLSFGRRKIYTNECHGTFFPFLPADEFFDREYFPWFAALEARTEAIAAEFATLYARGTDAFGPYVVQAPGTPANKWSPLSGSTDWSALYLWRYGARNDAACAACPKTAAAIEALPQATIPGRAPSAFFSVLKPRTRIPPHTGVTNTRAIVHLPLIVPQGCGFRVGGETRAWRVGEAFAFDDTIEHEAWNDSDELRAVLIFDVWNPHLTGTERELLCDFFAASDTSGFRPALHDDAG
ncbi:MAG: aspartyl/asparaginyl beta-hydroxylase domain-containing protein [Sphingomonadaceae bacterium]|nr:aspartyl/asparaginyl beta-hydroxylase domain-containing protein [Sphingomonadaceae bacterium]